MELLHKFGFSRFFWTLTFTFVSQISLKISINLDFFVWSCVANLFKMPAKSNYIFVIIPHSWIFLIKTKCGFCCFLWKHTTKLDYGVGNVNKTENMEFARSDIGQEWIICQIWWLFWDSFLSWPSARNSEVWKHRMEETSQKVSNRSDKNTRVWERA